jgi:hypothetical protein
MAASFILLLLPILRRRRRNKPDSLVSRRPLQKRVVRVNASVVLVQGRWALESDLALEFFYVRFAQLVVLSCTQREEGEREREESRVSRTRARVHEKNSKTLLSKEKDDIIIITIIIRKKENARNTTRERTNRRRARQRNSSSSNLLPNLQPLPPLVGLPVSPQRAKDVD